VDVFSTAKSLAEIIQVNASLLDDSVERAGL